VSTVREQDRPVAVITGASRGIGAGLVAGYRGQGWSVVANALTIAPSDDADVLAVEGDISDATTADRIVAGALERFGGIDTLVNNAGVFLSKSFTEYTADDYALMIGVNLTGFFGLTQRVIPTMLERAHGHIVNITTTLVDFANSERPSALTSLTKGGLAAATRALAIEYASRGVRVNAVSPGVVRTSDGDSDAYAELARYHPLGRVGQISDIVDGILFLEASPFVTGEILHIDGGQIAGR
jgi:NAD(P)-dependent dehydrogenase (short-subunit alcohol dehydrogenase family)